MVKENQCKLTATVGTNIAKRRKEKGLTQDRFSEYLEITQESLSRMEAGKIAPKFSRLPHIAKGLNCSVADLFRQPNESTQQQAINIAEQISSLSPEFQAIITDLVDKTVQVLSGQNK